MVVLPVTDCRVLSYTFRHLQTTCVTLTTFAVPTNTSSVPTDATCTSCFLSPIAVSGHEHREEDKHDNDNSRKELTRQKRQPSMSQKKRKSKNKTRHNERSKTTTAAPTHSPPPASVPSLNPLAVETVSTTNKQWQGAGGAYHLLPIYVTCYSTTHHRC